jgi:Uma2 family endonuclease
MVVSMLDQMPTRPLSRKEYDRMVELDFFDEDERIELLRGAIVVMDGQGWHHAAVTAWLTARFVRALDDTYEVRPRLPFAASDWSQPLPDLAIARRDYTLRQHPSELFLVIEVSDSSLRKDRGLKAAIYAEANVPEYWIIDLQAMAVEVHTRPVGDRYEHVETFHDGAVLRPTPLPGVEIEVAAIPR